MKKAAERKAQQSYASGLSAGYAFGTQDGLGKGSDQS